MQKIILLSATLLLTITSFAQFNLDAPWMSTFDQQDLKSNTVRFQEIVDAFNIYWETRDPEVKGSGYKPFKRWENYWQNYVNEDGYLPTALELENTVRSKNQMSQNRTNRMVSDWQPFGPFSHVNTGSWSSGQGRVNVVVQDPNSPTTYYVGAPAGGVWKSLDSGSTWNPLSDELGQIGVSGIAVDYNNSNTIYIATGDDDAGDSYSIGIMKSTDGGSTWQQTGLNVSNSPNVTTDLFINPNDSNVLWVATSGGIYKSIDAGVSWVLKLSGNFKALDIKPGDPNVVYALTSNRFYRSVNGGESFTQVTSGLPLIAGRLAMDVTPANPNVVYILAANLSYNFSGIYKSTDSGQSFTQTAAPLSTNILESTQAWYDLAIAVSSTDENTIFTGCLNVWKSTNGGDSFTKLNSWSDPAGVSYTHADIHYLQYFGDNFFVGSDGGIYRSTNDGANFADLTEGLQIGQFYRLAVSESNSNLMVGGLQDNGGYGYSNNTWNNYYGADGMDTAVNPINPNTYYGFIQNGGGLYISNNAGASLQQYAAGPATGNWVTPLSINAEGELFAGYSRLYKLEGLTFQPVSGELGGNISRLELDPSDSNVIYIALNNVLSKSTNHGVTFSTIYTFSTGITSIEVNNNDNEVVYVTTGGTAGKVMRSSDGGTSFEDITGSLPNVTKNVIKHRPEDPAESIFVGTSLGVFSFDDQLGVWETFDVNLPNVSVSDLEINIIDGNITASTYGRGVWRSILPAVESPANDIKLSAILSPVGNQVNCDTEVTPQITVTNNGTEPITEFDLVYNYDGGTSVTSNLITNIGPGSSVSVDLPQVTLSIGHHVLNVEAVISGDAFVSNNTKTVSFSVNSNSPINEINTFETPEQSLLTLNMSDSNALFERGVPSGTFLNDVSSGTQAYGTNLDGNYPDMTIAHLTSACYDLTGISDPILRFNMAFELEFDWDIFYVQFSDDIGATWQILGSSDDPNWYNSSRLAGDGIASDCYNCVGAQWTGTDLTMTEYSYDLAPYSGSQNFMVRFVFHSDQSVNEEGVVIDDLVITSSLSNQSNLIQDFAIHPNPTSGDVIIQLSQPSNFHYSVYDLTGKLVVPENKVISSNQIVLQLDSVARGLYFIILEFDSGQRISKKLIKE